MVGGGGVAGGSKEHMLLNPAMMNWRAILIFVFESRVDHNRRYHLWILLISHVGLPL